MDGNQKVECTDREPAAEKEKNMDHELAGSSCSSNCDPDDHVDVNQKTECKDEHCEPIAEKDEEETDHGLAGPSCSSNSDSEKHVDGNQKVGCNEQRCEPGASKVETDHDLTGTSGALQSGSSPKADATGKQTVFLYNASHPDAVKAKISRNVPNRMEFNVQYVYAEQGAQVKVGPTFIQEMSHSARQTEMDCLEHFRADKGNLFVCTDAFTESAAVLDKHHVLVVTGAPGIGKTFNSQQLLLQVCDEKQCSPFQPSVPEEYLQWCNTRERQAFLMDDLFGASSFNQSKYDAWMNVFPKMIQHLKFLNTYLLFSCRENILKSRLIALKATGLFNNVINLSDEKFQLTAENKKAMFLLHTNTFNIDMEYEELRTSQDICRDAIGFPQRVRLLCSMVNVSQESRMKYFNCPMDYLSTLIASYRESDHVAYCVLILLLLNDGQLPVSFLKYENKSSELLQRCLDICDVSASTMGGLRNKADSLCNYLLHFSSDKYVYQHPSVMEAVTLDFGQRYPSDFLNSCSVHFLLEHVFTQQSSSHDNEYVVCLEQSMFQQLSARLIREMTSCVSDQNGGMRSLASYAVFSDEAFNQVFLCHLLDTNSFHLILAPSRRDHLTFLFLAAASGQDAFVNEVFSSHLPNVQRLPGFSDHLNRIMYAACNSGSLAAVSSLLAAGALVDYRMAHYPDDVRYGSLDNSQTCTTMMHAAYSGSAEVLRLIIDRLQQQKVDVLRHSGIRDGRDLTALHWWAEGIREVAALQILIEIGADVHATDTAGQTALYWSAQCGDETAVRALVEAGADVHISRRNETPLGAAVRRGHTVVADFLLSHITLDSLDRWSVESLVEHLFTKDSVPDDNKYTVLLLSEMFPQLCAKLVKEIQTCVCSGGEGSSSERDASHSERDATSYEGDALYDEGDPRCLKSLAAYRVFLDPAFFHVFLCHLQDTDSFGILLSIASPDRPHLTFLFFAAASGQDAFVHRVLSFHLREVQRMPEFRNHLDRILYAACYSGSEEAARALLAAGARADFRMAYDPDQVTEAGWDEPPNCSLTLMHAAYSSNVNTMRLILDHLQQQRVDMTDYISIKDDVGMTALHWWAQGERGESALCILLETGADVRLTDDNGLTALHMCAVRGDDAAVRALLKAGADVDSCDNGGWTALNHVAGCGHDNVIPLLVKAGADVNIWDNEERTALHQAAEKGHLNVVRLLVKAGADVHLGASSPSSSSWYKPYSDQTPLEIAVLFDRTAVADFLRNLPSK